MIEKPGSITLAGVVQVILASTFVVWLAAFPHTGARFAWPTTPDETAMFLGVAFIGRVYIGYHLMRERDWARLRWQIAANYAFLAFVWLATLWHMQEMNWKSNFWVAHVWAIAYTFEPVVLFLWEPKGTAPPPSGGGPILRGLRELAQAGLVVSVTLAGLMMINPEFMNMRWPWELDPFNCRVMSAFFALQAGWCYWIYRADDWAAARPAVLGVMCFAVGELAVWARYVAGFDPGRSNRHVFGAILAAFAAALIYYFVRQERLAGRVRSTPA